MVNGISGNPAGDWRITSEAAKDSGIQITQNTVKSAGNMGAIKASNDSDSFAFTAAMGVGSAALFEGIPFGLYLKRNKKLNGEMTPEMKNLSQSTQNALNNLRHGNGKLTDRILNYFTVINANKKAYHNIQDITKAKANLAGAYEKASKKAVKAAENPNFYTNWRAKSAKSSLSETIKTASKPVTEGITNKIGIGSLMKSSGAGILMAFGGIIESITEVYPTFNELGSEKGFKQLGKSSVKVAGDTAGFIIGDQIGMAIGSAIGTALFPGAGTAIGAATGLVVGMFGSFAADKITEKIVGKSERELAKEQQEKNQQISDKYPNSTFAVSV